MLKYRFIRFPGFRTKAVTMSFDDGTEYDIPFVEILNRHGIKATFNLPYTSFEKEDGKGHVSERMARELYFPNGHDVAVHGEQHVNLPSIPAKDGIREVAMSRAFLEKFYGRIIRGMAYADFGATSPEVKSYVKMLGMTYARTAFSSFDFLLPQDWLEWKMTAHITNPRVPELIEDFFSQDPTSRYVSSRHSLLLSLWGHSFEYKNNMEDFDALCQRIGGHEDVWYVNNTELYEYCHAFDSLIFDIDNTRVYNPTHIPVYFEGSCKKYLVEPGQTLELN